MASDLARDALEPFAKAADKLWASVWHDNESAPLGLVSVGDFRRARTAYDAIGSGVKALPRVPYDEGEVSGWTLTEEVRRDLQKVAERWELVTLEAVEAIALEVERRVLSCLSSHTAARAAPVEEADAKARELEAASEEDILAGLELTDAFRAMLATPPASTIPSEPEAKAAAPEDRAEQYIQAAVDRAPEPLRRLGEWLANKLDEDDWKTAERMLLGAAWTGPAAFYVNTADMEAVKRPFGYAGHVGFDGMVRISDLPGEDRMPVYARPVEEPGEAVRLRAEVHNAHLAVQEERALAAAAEAAVERLTRERDEEQTAKRKWMSVAGDMTKRAETAEAALAETRERLEKERQDRDGDIAALLANLRHMEEIAGETLEDEDAQMVSDIEAGLSARRVARPVDEPGEVEHDPYPRVAGENMRLREEIAETRERLEKVEAENAGRLKKAVYSAALEWCGGKERETFPEDIAYFENNWRSFPGLRQHVELQLGRAVLSTQESSAPEAGR